MTNWRALTATLGLCLACCISCQVEHGRAEGEGAEDDSSEVRLVPVEVETVTRGRIRSFIHLNSVIETEAAVQVFPLVSGHVAEIRVEEGRRVQSGDTLLRLEDAEILLAEERARLEYDKTLADLERLDQLKTLGGTDLVTRQDLEDAEYRRDQAYLNWRSAALRVERSRVTAPIAGILSERLVRVGDYVTGGTRLFTLVDDRELIAVLDVPERELSRLGPGQGVTVRTLARGEREYGGWIKRIAPVVDPASGTVRVTVGVEDPPGQLRSGMYARCSIVTDTRENAILVPKRALLYDRDRLVVYVVEDSLASRRILSKGYEDEFRVEALAGLEAGESLVVIGQSGLKPGSSVRVVGDTLAAPETALKNAGGGEADSAAD